MKKFQKVLSAALCVAMVGNIGTLPVLAESQEVNDEIKVFSDVAADDKALDTVSDGAVYVLMNIPYSVFYADLTTEQVDVVSAATSQKVARCANVYSDGDPLYENGMDLNGVVFPVKMDDATYSTVKDLVDSAAKDYYISEVLTEVPSVYMELQAYSEGSYTFSEVQGETDTTEDVAATLTSNSVWGEYQLELADSSLGVAPTDVYGVYLTDSEGNHYPMLQSAHLWTPGNYYEFAWYTTEGSTDKHGAVQQAYADMEKQTISAITYITKNGLINYQLSSGLYVAPHYEGEVSAALSEDGTSVALTGLPEDIENATASVYYSVRKANGKGSDYYYAAEDVAITNGAVALESDIIADKTYNISITSDNYAYMLAANTIEDTDTAYVLMNIPYAAFYAGEGTSSVDAVSSATKAKTLTGTLAGGSYHVNSDGTDITGITYPVKLTKHQLSKLQESEYTEVKAEDVYEVTVTNRGQTSTTTYEGPDALFGKGGSYAYYVLSEEPSEYKVLSGTTENGYSFGGVTGKVTTVTDAAVELTTETNYGDYQISIKNAPFDSSNVIYGVSLSTKEKATYGLRHVENIWRATELAWSAGFTTNVHGCDLSYEPYVDMMGQTITKITYYTDKGIYEIPAELYVPIKTDVKVTAQDAAADEAGKGSTKAVITGLPEDFVVTGAAFSVTNAKGRVQDNFTVTASEAAGEEWAVTVNFEDALPGSYKLVVSDGTGVYADFGGSFVVSTDQLPVQFNGAVSGAALVVGKDATEADFQNYMNNITAVQVGETTYNTRTKVINSDGTINLDLAVSNQKVFGESGKYKIVVSATGYADYSFILTVSTDGDIILGDLNNDGEITLQDAQTALKIALRIENATDTQVLAGDVTGDMDGITLTDAQMILKRALRIVTSF